MSQDPRIGSEIAGFRIVSLIRRGGMGVVYLAQHGRLGRRVALKILPPELSPSEELRRRFLDREPRLAASVEHPNVLPIYDAGEEPDGTLWMAMRYVDGPDLGTILRDEGPLSLARTLHLVGQVADALDAAHEQGLIHRDVKPENVLVEGRAPREQIYLTDFGLTRRVSSERFTGSGAFMGSVHYASPEVIEGRADLDGRADVYSLGCVLFQCLTGRVPFADASDISVLYAHLSAEPPDLTRWRPELPPGLSDAIRTAMAKRAEDRYPTCGTLIEAARAAAALGEPVATTHQDPTGAPSVPFAAGDGADHGSEVDVSVQLVPIESQGRRSARHRIRIENRGLSPERVRLEADGRGAIVPAVSPRSVVVEPESVTWARVRVRPRARAFGRRRLRFRVIVYPEGADPIALEGAMLRPTPIAAVSVIAALVLAGGIAWYLWTRQGPLPEGAAVRSPSSSPAAERKPRTCPLRGTPALSESAPDGPALAVKVGNLFPKEARSQSGLFRADIVFEEPIEFGNTRLVAVFHCSMPDSVGPVRGPRPTDPDLLAQLGQPLFAFGNDRLAEPLTWTGVAVDVSENIEPNGYSRTDAGAPSNLFANPERLLATRTSTAPEPIFSYTKDPPTGFPGQPVVKVPFENLVWRYDEGLGSYVRHYGNQRHTSEGRPLSAANLIIQYVRVRQVSIAGKEWIRAYTVGKGKALVFRDGIRIEGTWSRPSRPDRAIFRDRRGRDIAMAPGVTWVELVPAAAAQP